MSEVQTEVPILIKEVPIPLDELAALKKVFAEAGEIAAIANNVGIKFIKEIAEKINLAAATVKMVEDAEESVNTALRRSLLNLDLKPEEYRGINLEKGVFKMQEPPVEVKVPS